MRVEYREEPCKVALNKVKGKGLHVVAEPVHGLRPPLHLLLRPAFELRAERPFDDRYGRSIRVKTNIAEVLRCELAPAGLGAGDDRDRGRDRSVPAGRGPLPVERGCLEALRIRQPVQHHHARPVDRPRRGVLAEAASAGRRLGHVLGADARRRGLAAYRARTAHPRQRLRALKTLVDAGIHASVGMAPILPGLSDKPELLGSVAKRPARPARAASAANLLHLKPGTREHFLAALAEDYPEQLPAYERLYARRAYLGAAETSLRDSWCPT